MSALRLTASIALLAIVGACGQPAPEPASAPAEATAAAPADPSSCTAITPAAGSPDRAAILDALRPRVEAMTGKPVEFEISRLEIACDYARLIAQPRAAGGTDRYEPVDALFERKDGAWSLALIAATEEGSDPAADQYKAARPDAPEALLYL